VAAAGACAGPAAARSGALDGAFGVDGLATVAPPPYAAVSVGEPLLWRGTVTIESHDSIDSPHGLSVSRFTPAGTLDQSFGGGGTVNIVPTAASSFASVDPAGRVLLGGNLAQLSPVIDERFRATRLTATGTIDHGWGPAGRGITIGSNGRSLNVDGFETDRSGRLYLARDGEQGFPIERTFVDRYTPTGLLDRGFGGAGHARTPLSLVSGLELAAGGAPLVSGAAPPGLVTPAIARLTLAGKLDDGFGTHGLAILPQPGTILEWGIDEVATDAAGGIDIVMTATNEQTADNSITHLAVVRLRADGQLDRRFGRDGVVVEPFDGFASFTPRGAAIDTRGRLVIVGVTATRLKPACAIAELVRVEPDGRRDATFGRDGVARPVARGPDACAEVGGVAFAPDGDIYVSGRLTPSADPFGMAADSLSFIAAIRP
jgi:uncharacterized delta-60 repeat protein